MQRVRVRRAEQIEEDLSFMPIVSTTNVAVVVADGFAVPAFPRILGMLLVQMNSPHLLIALIDERHELRRLQEEHRFEPSQNIGDPIRAAGRHCGSLLSPPRRDPPRCAS